MLPVCRDVSPGLGAPAGHRVTKLFCPAGLWSQIKRAPKAKKVRKTFETPGPKAAEALPLDVRARQIFAYFKKYNYTGRAAVHAAACMRCHQAYKD